MKATALLWLTELASTIIAALFVAGFFAFWATLIKGSWHLFWWIWSL